MSSHPNAAPQILPGLLGAGRNFLYIGGTRLLNVGPPDYAFLHITGSRIQAGEEARELRSQVTAA